MTPAQLVTFKNDIAADGTLNALSRTEDSATVIAAAYNAAASPDYWVWRTSVTKNEYVSATSVDSTTFNWTGTGFIARSAGEQAAWRELFNGANACNPSLANVRQAFTDIFSGATAPAPANRTHLAAISRRKASRAEKLFATGAGSTAAPSLMGVEGVLTVQDVVAAWNS